MNEGMALGKLCPGQDSHVQCLSLPSLGLLYLLSLACLVPFNSNPSCTLLPHLSSESTALCQLSASRIFSGSQENILSHLCYQSYLISPGWALHREQVTTHSQQWGCSWPLLPAEEPLVSSPLCSFCTHPGKLAPHTFSVKPAQVTPARTHSIISEHLPCIYSEISVSWPNITVCVVSLSLMILKIFLALKILSFTSPPYHLPWSC